MRYFLIGISIITLLLFVLSYVFGIPVIEFVQNIMYFLQDVVNVALNLVINIFEEIKSKF